MSFYMWITLNHLTGVSFFRYRNLQAAIGAYYDFESPSGSAPSMSFVKDVTIGEGESIPPDTPFIKTWRIQNTGTVYGTINAFLTDQNSDQNSEFTFEFFVVLQVQRHGLQVCVWGTLVEISLVTWTSWWSALWVLRRFTMWVYRCAVLVLPACTRASGGCAPLPDCSTEVNAHETGI